MTYIIFFWIYLLCDFLKIHQVCKEITAPLIQIQMQGHLLYTILLLRNFPDGCRHIICGISIDAHYPCTIFNVWMCSFFHYPIEVNWESNHLFQNLFGWCWSRIHSNPSPYKWVSPEIPLYVLPLPTETQWNNQCFPPPPNLMALMGRMQLRPREESARRNKRFWRQSWGLVCWREFQVFLPL